MNILGIGTATPEHWFTIEDRFDVVNNFFIGSEKERRLLPLLYEKTGVQKRYSCLLDRPDGTIVDRQSLYEPVLTDSDYCGPTVSQRMRAYEQLAGPLALRATQTAIERSQIEPQKITHLVTVSCTGFSAPGFDLHLMREMPLKSSVQRTHIGFMGCHGGLNGLRAARAFAASDPNACVLLCATELCSLHYQYSGKADQIVANALFSDGAMAVVVAGEAVCPQHNTGWNVHNSASEVVAETGEMMSWSIRDHGFTMSLSPQLPRLIEETVRPWLEKWLSEQGLSIDQINGWAVHPGGPRVITSFQKAMGLDDRALRHSVEVLRNFGNLSSATVFFIIERMMAETNRLPCVAIGFGPGITIEAALFTSAETYN